MEDDYNDWDMHYNPPLAVADASESEESASESITSQSKEVTEPNLRPASLSGVELVNNTASVADFPSGILSQCVLFTM